MKEELICRKIKCKDYLTDDGEPVWCYRAGCPANVAVAKCSKALEKQGDKNGMGLGRKPEQRK